jgi:hypothetical protein
MKRTKQLNKKIARFYLPALFLLLLSQAHANDAILKILEKEAKASDSKFKEFKANSGEKIFRKEVVNSLGEKVSCMNCHTNDPKKTGLNKLNKTIEPMAPIVNPERFTDMAKIQKWFKRNCKDVFERECTIQEKGDFTKFMMSIK